MSEMLFSVVKGDPTEEELAALVTTVLALRARGGGERPTTQPSGWSAYGRTVRAPVRPGPDAWRMSARPQ